MRGSVLALLAVLMAFALAPAVLAEPLPALEALEPLVGEGPELLAALAALERDEQLRALQEERQGPEVFGGLTYGYSDEPVTETSEETLSYRKVTARAGLAFPLLGSWNRRKIDLLQAEREVLEGRVQAEVVASRNVTALRKAYGLIVFEGKRRAFLEAFLDDEISVEALLAERVRKGFLLEADRLEFLSAFDMARRDLAGVKWRQIEALQAIRLATGRSWEIPEEPALPLLPGPLPDGETFLESVGSLAETRHLDDFIALRRAIAEKSDRLDRQAFLELGVTVGRDFPGSTGTGVYLGLVVREPFGTLTASQDRGRLAALADLERERRAGLVTRIRLEGELMEALVLREYALAAVAAARRRLDAAWEALRVTSLRHEGLAGDTFEKYQQSRYAYLRVALDCLEAQALLFQTEAELVRFAFPPGGPLPKRRLLHEELSKGEARLDPSWLKARAFPESPFLKPDPLEGPALAVPPEPASALSRPLAAAGPLSGAAVKPLLATKPVPEAPKQAPLAAYVWDARPFLDSSRRAEELDAFRDGGFRRMLLSFRGDQIASFRSEGGRKSLLALLEAARRRSIDVDLLLGDPAWILPESRQELMALIDEMASFPFRGLHLDLEPDSLPGASGRRLKLAGELVRTIDLARARTDRPLSLSVHPRELEGDLGALVGPGLTRAGLEEVAVMIYSTDAEAVIARFSRLRDAHPALVLALAQSVEAVLSPRESYAHLTRGAFRNRLAYLEESLRSEGFGGIIVQAWKDYREMMP